VEQFLTSLELSKKLKEKGVSQVSKFYWVRSSNGDFHFSFTDGFNENLLPDKFNYYSAYLTDELLRWLPKLLNDYYTIQMCFNPDNTFWVGYTSDIHKNNIKPCDAITEMLLWLIENKHVKVEDLK
jgi:hypothetical protein